MDLGANGRPGAGSGNSGPLGVTPPPARFVSRDGIIVSGDAAATATNIRSMESLWRFGVASEFFLLICGISLALIFCVLLRPVER